VIESQETPENPEAVMPDAAEAAPTAVPVEPEASAIQRLEEALAGEKDRYLRLAAEYDNFRKRVARERVELADRAQAALTVRLLDVLDDLDRLAVQDLSVMGREALHEALVLVDRKLRKELVAGGLERLDPVGQAFDPAEHEAVTVVPAPDPALDHQVSAVLQAGYKFKGALVRPARVQVYTTEG